MTFSSRNQLKSRFTNKSHLSEAHFEELINSVLNKRDDRFHGLWQSGKKYQPGDLVYFNKKLWYLSAKHEICANPKQRPGNSPDWTWLLQELSEKISKTQQDLEKLRQDFTEYKQQTEKRLSYLNNSLSVLTTGLAIAFFWFFGQAAFHLLMGKG